MWRGELRAAWCSKRETIAHDHRSMKRRVRPTLTACAWTWLDQAGQDVRLGLRDLGNKPGFTCVAVLTLGPGCRAPLGGCDDAAQHIVPVDRWRCDRHPGRSGRWRAPLEPAVRCDQPRSNGDGISCRFALACGNSRRDRP